MPPGIGYPEFGNRLFDTRRDPGLVQDQMWRGPRGDGNFTNPTINNLGGALPPTAGAGTRTPTAPNQNPKGAGGPQDFNPSGNPQLDALRQQAANQFRLGEFDLLDPATNKAANDLFGQIIAAAGGDYHALRDEIGAVRLGDRMREFFGKGDTLNQSGVIQVGNGQTINSLRDLGDFNNPNAGPGGGGGGSAGAGGAAPGGGGLGGLLGGGAGGGGFSANANMGGPNPGFLGFLEGHLRDRIGGQFGIDPEVAAQQRAALTSQSMRNQQGAFGQLAAQMNAAGGLGGGRHGALGTEMATGFNESLLNQLANFDMGLNQLGVQDRQAAFGEGGNFANTLVNQQLGLGDIGVRRQGLGVQRELGLGDLGLRRELGLGNLALGQGQLDLSRILGLGNLGLQDRGQRFDMGLQTRGYNDSLFR